MSCADKRTAGYSEMLLKEWLTNSISSPSSIVDKICKYKLRILMRRRLSRHSDQYDNERDQRRPQRDMRDRRQGLRVAVEYKGEQIRRLICHKNMPWMDGTAITYQSAAESSLMPPLWLVLTYKSG